MPSPATRAEVLRFWTRELGVSPEGGAGVRVGPWPAERSSSRILIFCRESRCIVVAPRDLLPVLEEAVDGEDSAALLRSTFWVRKLEGSFAGAVGPAYLGYADRLDFQPIASPHARLLEADDQMRVDELRAAVEAEEWEHSGLSAAVEVAGYFTRNGSLAGAAGYVMWGEQLAHLGVLVHPAHRGSGIGSKVVSAAGDRALARGFVLQYRTLWSNAASVRIARQLGFEQFATTLAVRRKATEVDGSDRDGPSAVA